MSTTFPEHTAPHIAADGETFRPDPKAPLSANRADIHGRMSPGWALSAWEASVADAAHDLRKLITIHDNGGTASSVPKIKSAARELLRLIGED